MRFQERRKDLLATRVLTLEQFIEEEDQLVKGDKPDFNLIPVLLRPGEITEQYENEFKDWLCRRDVNRDALYPRPEVERRFRLDFADSRAWELRRQSVARHQKQTVNKKNGPTGLPVGKKESYCHTRSREELLAMKEMTPDAFLMAMGHFGPNGPMVAGERLRPIAVILRPNETRRRCEINFQRWLRKKHITLDFLEKNPEEERRHRQAFAYARTREHARRKRLATSPPQQRSRYRSRSRSSERNGPRQSRKRSASSESRRRSASTSEESGLQDSSPVQKRTRHEPSSFEESKEMKTLQLNDGADQKAGELYAQNPELVHNEDETSAPSASAYAPDTPQSDSSSEPANALFVAAMAEDNTAVCLKNTASTKPTSKEQVDTADVPAKVGGVPHDKAEKLANNAGNANDIRSVGTNPQRLHSAILEATRILARAKGIVSDPTKKLLVNEYTRVTDRSC
ncbi:hypothetical protein PHYPSEUDO_006610 [Phytophthora pseudosyringae]|uniref:Uncharacterized protein n=1 Tax=Phytophthora pseudosyringae TaxID=221518 RepID=A0A8T1VIZ3_9STRA|nr:hypothetical protein PHYPSEUDO_006610 [Phytophthora pseudosyringae]